MGREVVKQYFSEQIDPDIPFGHNSAQCIQLISTGVKKVLDESLFLKGLELDTEVNHLFHADDLLMCLFIDQGRTENFGHPGPIELCKRFYYSDKSDCLSVLFPHLFQSLLTACLVMACTCVCSFLLPSILVLMYLQIVNCLREWEMGSMIGIPFTGESYNSVYTCFTGLINQTLANPYHGHKLEKLLAATATDGLFVIPTSTESFDY